ncbi:hypothetical protein BGZ81_004414 [Podila clonocystis]|nr:hypothetical protein BGZ81_004414 [Podila clonocystis]
MVELAAQDYKSTSKEAGLLVSNVQKVLQIPELLNMICSAVSNIRKYNESTTFYSFGDAKRAIRQLRLVSRAFHETANAFFSVEIDSIEASSVYSRYWAKPAEQIAAKIVACGPYIHDIYLDDDNDLALEAVAEHCSNVREVSLVFQEMPGCSVSQGDYSGVLAKWASLPHNKLETVNAIMSLEDAKGRAVFKDFDSLRRYFRDIKELTVQCRNPNEHHTVEIRDRCYTPIKWERFLSFLTYFHRLESLYFNGFFIDWDAMPARVLDPISFEPLELRNLTFLGVGRRCLEVSVVFRLNRLLPCLKSLILGQIKSQTLVEDEWESTYEDTSDDPDGDDDSDEDESENDEDDQDMATEKNSGNPSGQSSSATDISPPAAPVLTPVPDESMTTKVSSSKVLPIFDYESSVHVRSTLSLERLCVDTAHIVDLAELTKWAPKLKFLICHDTKFLGDPSKDKEDRMTALGPLNDRVWGSLDLLPLGKWTKRELDEYLQDELETTEVESTSA